MPCLLGFSKHIRATSFFLSLLDTLQLGFSINFMLQLIMVDILLQVLRVMSSLLGVVVFSGGPAAGWDRKTKLLIANHISTLDHMAVDLIEPCVLPSVWDIPNILQWLVFF